MSLGNSKELLKAFTNKKRLRNEVGDEVMNEEHPTKKAGLIVRKLRTNFGR